MAPRAPAAWGAVIAAAGRGVRFGRPKQLLELAGKPMLAWSCALFAGMPEIEAVVVVTEAELVARVEALVAPYAGRAPIRVVAGGADRQASVKNGVWALPATCDGVLVHDGARPLVDPGDVRRAMALVAPGSASLLASPVVDTVKEIDEDGGGRIARTIDRSRLWAAQTPQLATLADLRRALLAAEEAAVRGTDEASLLERIDVAVFVAPASPENFKVTFPADLERAEAILRARALRTPQEAGA